ncbi:tyrosine-protein phosphatase [Scatolibacter rhodanostii]|uniref:tyrosine-protein phosphatase n=1 Tax=Scatolibacter rhodanostii TaxID=2014781 RepID=UPI0013566F12|nr:tyrosine-protein phosphatase [Scatolibacter rhodanostii]
MSKRRIILDNTENTRDLGGYPTDEAKITKYGVFLRSAVPVNLSKADSKMLKQMGINTIIDFRVEDEIERVPSYFADKADFIYYSLPIRGSHYMRNGPEAISAAYMKMLQSEAMPKIFKIQAEMSGGCLFHCTAGKDRTGTVAAILLLLAGVSDLDIVADYVMSYPYLARFLTIFQKEDPNFPAYVLRSDPEYMQGFLALFHEEYGTAENYLASIGVTNQEIEKLRAKLVD